jgi:hypothetical protein
VDSISDSNDRFSDDSDGTDASGLSIVSSIGEDHNTDDETFQNLLSNLEPADPEEADWSHLFNDLCFD